ncbi:MAG: hypothetical protein ACR2H2_08365 [Solirubrobacteraceae bacterium]
MSRRATVAVALALTAAFAAPAGALAADAPTLGAPTVIPAGQKTPIDVGGNHLHQHDIIRRGTQLLRWPVTMHGASKAAITLTCPSGTIHSGLGLQEGSKVAFAVVKGSEYFERSIDVRFHTAPKVDPNGATGHVYALCRDTSIAPLAPALGFPTIRKAGQRSPIDVAGNNLHQGDRIRRGTQLVRWPVTLRGPSNAYLTLSCPRATVHRGLGFREGSKISASLSKNSRYGHNTLKVRFRPRTNVSANETTGSIYALCASR